MSEELLVNVTPQETRVAVIENGSLQEVQVERTSHRGYVGNIYKGRVVRVLPGMQAAFVDIGVERTSFIHVNDIVAPGSNGREDRNRQPDNIADHLHEGKKIIVQVTKDPIGTKGARLTTFITIPSRYLVMIPYGEGVGVSARIEDDEEREHLRQIIEGLTGSDGAAGGYIVRTAAEGATADELSGDMLFLRKLWDAIEGSIAQSRVGDLVYEDLPLAVRLLRDLLSSEMERVRVDSEVTFNKMKDFASRFMPHMSPTIEHYTGERPIFDLYSIEDEIERGLGREVSLKSGGYLIIDQTEAMTTVDVNTGAYVGHRNLEETSFRTNLEAAVAIARQLRLRNLGGIIIIDFIDMLEEDHRRQVLQELSRRLSDDHAKSHVMSVSPLGLVEMTRKRNRESLEHILCQACPSCEGRGFVKSLETVCYEIFREILRQHAQFDFQELLVLARPEVVERLLDEESASVAELEELTNRPIRLQSEGFRPRDQFDVVLM